MGSKCHLYLFFTASLFKGCFSRAPVSARLPRCPGYCAESQIIAPLLLLLKTLYPLICSGGLQFFFSNAISFSTDGTAPNDPKHLLASFFIFRGLWRCLNRSSLVFCLLQKCVVGGKWLIEDTKVLIAFWMRKEGFINGDSIHSLVPLWGTPERIAHLCI